MTEQDYRRLFDRVAPGPELVERTIKAAEGGVRPRRKRHLARRVAVIAAAAALLGGMATSFAAVKTVSPNAVKLEEWTAAGLGTPVGVSASDLGWTVTVDGVASDRWYAYILCTLSRDDGQAITQGNFGFGTFDFGFPYRLNWSASIHWLEDSDPTDNQVPFALYVNNADSWDMAGTAVDLTLWGLSTADRAESWALLLQGGGRWELTFTLPAESKVQDFTAGLEFQIEGKTAILETVSCTPLEMIATFTSPDGAFAPFSITSDDFDRTWREENSPVFVLADGTEWAPDSTGGGLSDGSLWHYSYQCGDKEPLDPGDIVGLRIGETVCPLTLE